MSIASYILTCHDDLDVLPNAVASVAPFSDRVVLVDTGWPFHSDNPVEEKESVYAFSLRMWRGGIPCTYHQYPWSGNRDEWDYSRARNYVGKLLASFDWIYQIDSDEMVSREWAAEVKAFANGLPMNTTTVAPRMLTLYPDEAHYVVNYSQHLTHGRLQRPRAIRWRGRFHEHQDYFGERLEVPYFHLHLRQLWENRCKRQRSHGIEGWQDITEDQIAEVSELGVSWNPIIYPKEDARD